MKMSLLLAGILLGSGTWVHSSARSSHIRRTSAVNHLESQLLTYQDRSRRALLVGDHELSRYYENRCTMLLSGMIGGACNTRRYVSSCMTPLGVTRES